MQDQIVLKWVRTHNLKDIDIILPKNMLITITGVSWSGKSSLAFHTIYKEGQFRYIESLSAYLRQFFNLGTRPEIDMSMWLSPAIAIEQNKRMGNSRSTVGTLTEMDDFLRLLLSKLGVVHCHVCGDVIRPKNTDQIVWEIMEAHDGQKIYLLQEYGKFTESKEVEKFFRRNRKQVDAGGGSTRLLVSKAWEEDFVEYFYLEDYAGAEETCDITIYGVFDRIKVTDAIHRRLKEDVIKMLGRADKFGVRVLGVGDEVQEAVKAVWVQEAVQKQFLMTNNVEISDEWKQKLLEYEHTAEWCIVRGRAIVKNEKWEYLGMFDTRFDHYQTPWGKIDIWETVESGLIREVKEELWVEVESCTYIWQHKLFFQLWLSNPHVYEVKIKWEPQVMEKEKFSHIAWWTVKKTTKNPFGKKVVFDDDTRDTIWWVLDGGYHFYIYVENKFYEKLWDTSDFAIELLDRKIITESGTYIRYADLKNSIYRLVEKADYKKSKNNLFVFQINGEQALKWYYQVFGVSELQDIQKSNIHRPITRYTDKYLCANDNIKYPEMTPAHFSSNRQEWACEQCHGLGEVLQVDFDKVIDPYAKYMDAILPRRDSKLGQAILRKLAYTYQVKDSDRWMDLPDWFIETVKQWDNETYKINLWWGKYVSMVYKWIEDVLISQYQKWVLTVDFQAMLDMRDCPTCDGAKLKKESLAVKLQIGNEWETDYNIHDLQTMPISELVRVMEAFLWSVQKERVLVERILNPLLDRAKTITHLWLGYLSTSRKVDTLSGGEIQRLRLAKQLWTKLTGIIYVLDEPTIWLDAGEIKKVIQSIRWLQEMWNTIIVVEHNEEFMRASDWIVEVWPGAGDFGGNIIYNGPYDAFLEQDSLTSQYLTAKKKIQWTFTHKPSKHEIKIKNARKYNLQGIDVSFKLGAFNIITGPSGAWKTTLMYHTFFTFLQEKQKRIQSRIRLQMLKEGMTWQEIIQAPIMQRKKFEHLEQLAVQEFYEHIWVDAITGWEHIDNVLYVNQSSIWKTPRSCPATFVGVFDDIRKMFAGVTESKMLGFTSWHFSFNSKKWACPECNWYGYNKVELQFLPDTYVPCEMCKWHRYKPEILDIQRHGKRISEILDMYIKDAIVFFDEMSFIRRKLELMVEIGLWYLKMWQPAHMLSGGESQRLKLVKHLLKSYKWHTVYFLDEPTVWLHADDITRLLTVLKRFLDDGATILMIEHEQSMLQFADQVIRLKDGKLG